VFRHQFLFKPEEEIVNSGARDFIDILRLVPGFEFGYDVEGVTSAGLRGIWGHEGKILLLVDGQEMNELTYATIQLGSHYNVNNIKRIEILRGPGSCVYGGFAELAVINIITRKSDDLNGLSASAQYGQMTHSYGRMNGSIEAGKMLKDADFSVSAFGSLAQRSAKPTTVWVETDPDNDGWEEYEYGADRTDLKKIAAGNVNAGLNYRNLSTRFIYDYYSVGTELVDYDAAAQEFTGDTMHGVTFNSLLGEVKYRFDLTGSGGYELEYRLRYNWGYASASYSYYNAGLFDKNTVETYAADGNDNALLGFPVHKVGANACFFIGSLSVNPSVAWLSERFVYDAEPESPVVLANLYLRYKDLFTRGLSAGIGVYNIFDQDYDFVQPYQGDYPYPGPGFEAAIKLTYDWKW